MERQRKEVILEPYLTQVMNLHDQMHFHLFKNKKPYSFDYNLKSQFDLIVKEVKKKNLDTQLAISPALANKIPIFLPSTTSCISFFSYKTKSVRQVEINSLEAMLHRQALKQIHLGNIDNAEIDQLVKTDLETFKKYDAAHKFIAYRTDINHPI